MSYTIEPLSNQHCAVGENPYWHPHDRAVLWTDITAGLLHRYDPGTGRTETVYRGEQVGGFTLQADGKLLLFRVSDVATFDIHSREVRPVVNYSDPTMKRFNDVHADPRGRVLAGTIGATSTSGGLYRVDLDGHVTKLFDGTGCSNGMAFSPDEATLYWTCSTRRKIFAYDYDADAGSVSNERVFYDCPEDEKTPDGMGMDRDGNLWSTRWGSGLIVVIDPRGKLVEKIVMPVKAVSCCIFGGEKNDELFVTTAGGKPDSETADGTLYRLRTRTTGRPRFQSRILM